MKNLLFFPIYFFFSIGLTKAQIGDEQSLSKTDLIKSKDYCIQQATSDKAQLNTISFNALAFITGNFGADCFFPPGKVSDFFGFQYMRDNDSLKLGHNTNFLTIIANNVISILNTAQLNKMISLAKEQEAMYNEFVYKRMVLIKAFRQNMEREFPKNSKGLNKEAVIKFCGELYSIDGRLSCRRAEVIGGIINSFTESQKNAFSKLSFNNSASWSKLSANYDKTTLSHRAHVCLMTYASELFSWYKGSETADVYFCPERHGTYFGGFYLKDFAAMGNNNYFISTSLTCDLGEAFLQVLNNNQLKLMQVLLVIQKNNLNEIVNLRKAISDSLRKFLKGEIINKNETIELVRKYGEQDGEMSYHYATTFAEISETLTLRQKKKLKKLRNQDRLPLGVYEFSDPIEMPPVIDVSFLF